MSAIREALRAVRAIYSIAHGERKALPRLVAESAIPVISIDGTPRDCGREYAERVRRDYPGYERYLARARTWPGEGRQLRRLIDLHAPHLDEFHAGMCDVIGGKSVKGGYGVEDSEDGCTSFSVAPSLTLDGGPLAGQNKDTDHSSAGLYVVLKISMAGGPKILTVAYPGEVLGYGFWSTGVSLFRNSLHSRTVSTQGVSMSTFGLLALSCGKVELVEEYASRLGIQGRGNFLISDASGKSIALEWNSGGLSVLHPNEGILTHANHAVGLETAPHEGLQDPAELECSRHRMAQLRELLQAESGRLSAQRGYQALADHSCYPSSICRHVIRGSVNAGTTASIVAEPAKGLLHVTLGNPCSNWPSTFHI